MRLIATVLMVIFGSKLKFDPNIRDNENKLYVGPEEISIGEHVISFCKYFCQDMTELEQTSLGGNCLRKCFGSMIKILEN